MKRFAVLLIVLLLGGCAVQTDSSVPEVIVPPESDTGLYDPHSEAETESRGALRRYNFGSLSCSAITAAWDGLLLFSETPEGTVLTWLTGVDGVPVHHMTLPFSLSPEDPSLQVTEQGFSCYDLQQRRIVLIRPTLEIEAQFEVPEDLVGSPILSRDGSQLCYTTDSQVRVLDRNTGISRLIYRFDDAELMLTALLDQEQILQCQAGETTLFLCTQSGTILQRVSSSACVTITQTGFYAKLTQGSTPLLVFGSNPEAVQTLTFPQSGTVGYFLPEIGCALGVRESHTGNTLSLYHLASGERRASLSLGSIVPDCFVCAFDGSIWFLGFQDGTQALYRWDPEKSQVQDNRVYTSPYQSHQSQNPQHLEACNTLAQQLQSSHGIEICLYSRGMELPVGSYRLEQEHQAAVLQRELGQLEIFLGSFPEGVLQALAERFGGVTICLVRSFDPGPGAPPDGFCSALYWDGYHPYIFLCSEADSQKVLAHTLCHLMDTVVINSSSAYDTWNQLNPTGFQYDCDYTANANRNSTAYLMDSNRFFVDMFSMSFPKEDRARIMEFAMAEGNAALFQGKALQNKLSRICTGIREAFGLKKHPAPLPWEQYLIQ